MAASTLERLAARPHVLLGLATNGIDWTLVWVRDQMDPLLPPRPLHPLGCHRRARPRREHRMRQGRGDDGLCFGPLPERAFDAPMVAERAKAAWYRAGGPISLHECRHTYAAFMIAAGQGASDLPWPLEHHRDVDRYGHLIPGAEMSSRTRLP